MREEHAETCILCGTPGTVIHSRVRDNIFGVAGEWRVRSCPNAQCGLCWLDPKPVADDLHESYSHYFTHSPGTEDSHDRFNALVRRIVRRLERTWLALLGQRKSRRDIECLFLNSDAPGEVLEVGCGDGARLVALNELGWSVHGQEVDEDAAAVAASRGYRVFVGELGEIGLPAAAYDAVVMNHVLEHLHDPGAVLAECRRILKPGGLFVATTPNTDSYGHRKFGPSWIGLDPPRHLHLFPPTAALQIAKRAGFEQCAVSTSSARAGYFLAASREVEGGGHEMGGSMSASFVLSATWYQLTARLAQVRAQHSGEETVLRAR